MANNLNIDANKNNREPLFEGVHHCGIMQSSVSALLIYFHSTTMNGCVFLIKYCQSPYTFVIMIIFHDAIQIMYVY